MASGITILLYCDVRAAFQSTITRISPPSGHKTPARNVASPFRTDFRQLPINGDVECFHPAINRNSSTPDGRSHDFWPCPPCSDAVIRRRYHCVSDVQWLFSDSYQIVRTFGISSIPHLLDLLLGLRDGRMRALACNPRSKSSRCGMD